MTMAMPCIPLHINWTTTAAAANDHQHGNTKRMRIPDIFEQLTLSLNFPIHRTPSRGINVSNNMHLIQSSLNRCQIRIVFGVLRILFGCQSATVSPSSEQKKQNRGKGHRLSTVQLFIRHLGMCCVSRTRHFLSCIMYCVRIWTVKIVFLFSFSAVNLMNFPFISLVGIYTLSSITCCALALFGRAWRMTWHGGCCQRDWFSPNSIDIFLSQSTDVALPWGAKQQQWNTLQFFSLRFGILRGDSINKLLIGRPATVGSIIHINEIAIK